MAAADTRELILQRIAAICTAERTGAGLVTAVRNRGLLKNDKRPAVVLLDGDERTTSSARSPGRNMGLLPSIVTMSPEMYVTLAEARIENDDIGEKLNSVRVKLLQAIGSDEQLKTLTGSNGGIVYNGCVTDLKSGSPLTGQMRLDFEYTYTLKPVA